MEKLSIEEKAERYDRAIKRANELNYVSDKDSLQYKTVVHIFPELKESEDEDDKIRNYILSHFKEHLDKTKEFLSEGMTAPFSSEEIKMLEASVTWIEKQKEQKLTLPKWRYKNSNSPLLRDSLILNKYGRVAKSPSGALVSDVWIMDYDELAKLPKEEEYKK